MKRVLLFFISFLFLSSITGQNCFEISRTEGLQSFAQKEYHDAIIDFYSAIDCIDCTEEGEREMNEMIEKARVAAENELQQKIKEAEETLELARLAQTDAEKAKILAQENEKKAIENGQQAESLRLTLLADIERRRKNYDDALYLAFYGLQLSDPSNWQDAYICFARVARDSFLQQIPIQGNLKQVESNDSALIMVDDSGVTVWNPETIKIIKNFSEYNKILFSKDHYFIIGHQNSGDLKLIDLTKIKNPISLKGHEEPINYIAESEHYFLTCSRDDSAILWDKKGQKKEIFKGHEGNVYQGVISENEDFIVTRSSDGTVIVWSLDGNIKTTIDSRLPYINSMDVNQDGLILLGDSNGGVSVWDSNGNNIHNLNNKHNTPVGEVAFGEIGKFFVSKASDNSMNVWNMKGDFVTKNTGVDQMEFIPGKNMILTRSIQKGISLSSAEGHSFWDFNDFSGKITGVDFNVSANNFLTTNVNGSIHLLDGNGEVFLDHKVTPNDHLIAEFGEDDKYFYCYDSENTQVEIIPMPQLIYNDFLSDYKETKKVNPAIAKKYNVRFLK